MAVTISRVEPNSKASLHRIRAGDRLLFINAHEIIDCLDYRFYIREKRLELKLLSASGRERTVHIRKKESEEIGLEFDTYLMDRQHSCKNKCIFCFVDQMPPGMRESLYFKDDDSRLSFLFGNYITLTGLSEREAQRIMDMHLSPVNISVHTVNEQLRVQMMKNPAAGESLSYLRRFADAGISMNTQLVLCPGINDGDELVRSLTQLSEMYPAVTSIAAVPVGLTKYRDGLYPLKPYDREGACAVIDTVESFATDFYAKHGTRLCFAADEFYLLSGREMPPYEAYEDFLQLDNGVGMWRLTESEFCTALDEEPPHSVQRTVSLVTGEAAYPLITKLCTAAQEKFPGLSVSVYAIRNDFFGHTVTVAGLVTGGDIQNQLSGKALGDELIVPQVMLRHGENVFLDDITTDDIAHSLGVPVRVQPSGGGQLLCALLGQA